MSALPSLLRAAGEDELPKGYARVTVRGATVVATEASLDAIRVALEAGTLYEYAARHHEARLLVGRGTAYAVPLPSGERVVVRHNRHGGLLARLTGDRFLAPTRAPYELFVSDRLTLCGVLTPPIIAYAVYPAGPLLRRSDVVSVEIPNSTDLSEILVHGNDAERREALHKAAFLIGELSAFGARHHDLNIKNVLLSRCAGFMAAYLLDVDRVTFGPPGDDRLLQRNLERFARSARKWRKLHGARVDERELEWVAVTARRVASSPADESPSTRS